MIWLAGQKQTYLHIADSKVANADTAQSPNDRERIYRALGRRNEFIALLRIMVPLLGVVILFVLLFQIIVANLTSGLNISGVRIEKNTLVIDAPEYSGIMANGTRYTIIADAAAAAISGRDLIELSNARVDLVRPDGYRMLANAANAQFQIAEQKIEVVDLMTVSDSYGMSAKLLNVTIDWVAQTLVARDNVYVTFADGSVLTGGSLIYDAGRQVWEFSSVKLIVPNSGDAE